MTKLEVLAGTINVVKSSAMRPQKVYHTMKATAENDQQCPCNKKQVTVLNVDYNMR